MKTVTRQELTADLEEALLLLQVSEPVKDRIDSKIYADRWQVLFDKYFEVEEEVADASNT